MIGNDIVFLGLRGFEWITIGGNEVETEGLAERFQAILRS
jgi:hypothetical protein